MIKSFIKRGAELIAPESTTAFFSARARAHSHDLVQLWGLGELNEKLVAALGSCVQAGPFKGMTLTPMTWKEHLGPYLLGSYEAEIHPWLDDLLRHRFTSVIDIGAKFGYYAVGLARRMPGVQVVAFDTDPWARSAMDEMARANGIGEALEIRSFCTPELLASVLTERPFIISDCEGYEHVLFGKNAVPGLGGATMLVELHEELSPGVSTAIRSAFRASHSISEVNSDEAMVRAVPPVLEFLGEDDARRAMRELRPPQTWLLLRPRDSTDVRRTHGRPAEI